MSSTGSWPFGKRQRKREVRLVPAIRGLQDETRIPNADLLVGSLLRPTNERDTLFWRGILKSECHTRRRIRKVLGLTVPLAGRRRR